MSELLSEIEAFLTETGMSAWYFGFKAANNGRLVERLREGTTPINGKPVELLPSTERKVRDFIAERRAAKREDAA